MMVVPAGAFRMGCVPGQNCQDDESPVHRVTIGAPFAVGVYEVTFEEWEACVRGGGCDEDAGYDRVAGTFWGRERLPVVKVSWEDAHAYVAWLSRESGAPYRLLSEAEWEYVARAGGETAYGWGDAIGENRANCLRCGSRWDMDGTAPVGSFQANGFGLYDVHGNVQEWVEDCWNGSYVGAPTDGTAWTRGDCDRRVVRGGSWFNLPGSLRSAHRDKTAAGGRHFVLGFRVARRLEKRPAFVPDPEPDDVRDAPAVPDLAAIAREMPGPAADREGQAGRRARDGALRVGQTFRDPLRSGGEGPEMVVVPAGAFRMGCVSGQNCQDDESPVHRVTIGAPFAVGVYEVTFAEWEACVRAGGCEGYRSDDRGWGRGRRPVISVSWEDAQAYVAWLSGESGAGYRLLSEAEWEYVARAGSETAYGWGNAIGRNRANCDGCGSRWDDKQTAPVGSFRANAFGLHDVHGNVWEWVEDCWNGRYAGAPMDGSAWEQGNCDTRVVRGGSWSHSPRSLRSADRIMNAAGLRFSFIGFRVARRLTP